MHKNHPTRHINTMASMKCQVDTLFPSKIVGSLLPPKKIRQRQITTSNAKRIWRLATMTPSFVYRCCDGTATGELQAGNHQSKQAEDTSSRESHTDECDGLFPAGRVSFQV